MGFDKQIEGVITIFVSNANVILLDYIPEVKNGFLDNKSMSMYEDDGEILMEME